MTFPSFPLLPTGDSSDDDESSRLPTPPSLPSLPSSTSAQPTPSGDSHVASTSSSSDQTSSTSAEVECLQVSLPVKESVLANATIEDIVVSAGPSNPIKKPKKGAPPNSEPCTRLQSIMDIPILDLSVDDLRPFVSSIQIKSGRRMTKLALCQAIVERKTRYEQDKASGKENEKKVPATKKGKIASNRVIINKKRFLNVLFGDKIRPLLAERSKKLSPKELTQGMKKDQIFHEKLAEQYNDESLYNENAHTHIRLGKNHSPPSKFSPIDWQKSSDVMRNLCFDYEKCFANWKQSGTHGDFEDSANTAAAAAATAAARNEGTVAVAPKAASKPFSDFVNQDYIMLYMHEFVFQFPDALTKMTGQLPSHCFTESPGDTTAMPSRKKRKGNNTEDKDKEWREYNKTNSEKAKALSLAVAYDSWKNASDACIKYSKEKRELMKEAEDACTNRANAVQRYKGYKKKVANLDNDDDDEDEYVDSQESLFEQIYEIDQTIEKAKADKSFFRKALDEKQNDTVNAQNI